MVGLAVVLSFLVGLFARGKPIPGDAAIKQSESDNAKLADAANNAVGQLKADNAAIGASSTVMGGLVQSANNLVDESQKLIDEANGRSAKGH